MGTHLLSMAPGSAMPGGRHVLLGAQLLSAPAVALGPRPQFPWPSRQTAHSRSQSWGQDRSRGEKPLPCFHPHGWLDREKRSHLPRSQGSPSQLGEQMWSHKAPPDFLASERRWVDSCFPCKACLPDTVCKGRSQEKSDPHLPCRGQPSTGTREDSGPATHPGREPLRLACILC